MALELLAPAAAGQYVRIEDRNTNTEAYMDYMRKRGLVRGVMHYKGEPTSNPPWLAVTPDGQYVPADEGSHFMYVPYERGRFLRPANLTAKQITPLAASMIAFTTQNPEGYTNYNIAPDLSRKTSQTFHGFHIHHFNLPPQEHMHKLDSEPAKLSEPGWRFQNSALLETCANASLEGVVGLQEPEEYPKGGTRLMLDENLTPEQLAVTLKQVDTLMHQKHREIATLFVNNYDEVFESRGEVPFDCKTPEERRTALDTHFADGSQPATEQYARFINRAIRRSELLEAKLESEGKTLFDPGDDLRLNAMTRMPGYSVLFGNDPDSSNKVLTVSAHLLRDRGGLEMMGILMSRPKGGAENVGPDNRMNRAVASIDQLQAAL